MLLNQLNIEKSQAPGVCVKQTEKGLEGKNWICHAKGLINFFKFL